MAKRQDGGAYSAGELSPYLEPRSEVKQTFAFTAALVKEHSLRAPKTLLDVGCADGGLTAHLMSEFPESRLEGIDTTPAFIAVANARGLEGVTFHVGDVRQFTGSFDVVTCVGTLPMFDDPLECLSALVGLGQPGGLVIVEGLFNSAGFDVQIEYRHHVVAHEPGEWHYGLNSCSMPAALTHLGTLGVESWFVEMPFTMDLSADPSPEAPRWSTLKTAAGERLLVNELGMFMRHRFLVARVP